MKKQNIIDVSEIPNLLDGIDKKYTKFILIDKLCDE